MLEPRQRLRYATLSSTHTHTKEARKARTAHTSATQRAAVLFASLIAEQDVPCMPAAGADRTVHSENRPWVNVAETPSMVPRAATQWGEKALPEWAGVSWGLGWGGGEGDVAGC